MKKPLSIVRIALVLGMGAISFTAAGAQGKGRGNDNKPAKPAAKTQAAKPKTTVVTKKPTVIVGQPMRTVVTSGGDVAPPGQLKKQLGLKSARSVAPGHVKRTMPDAINATRTVLISNGYEILRVMPYNGTQIVYYRLGPTGGLERIVISPDGDRFAFRYAPAGILSGILARLGM